MTQQAGERVAFCSSCRGVVPVAQVRQRTTVRLGGVPIARVRRLRLRCGRCGTLYGHLDPAAAGRHRALRYFLYACASGLMASLLAATASPPFPLRETLLAWLLFGICLGCLLRAIGLRLQAADFQSLTPWEVDDLGRHLCPGMIRSDVVDELARHGWPIGKIRTALSSLRPRP